MCLACEMDALWFAELEAAAGQAAGTAGVPPALPRQGAVAQEDGSATAGGTPAVPGSRAGGTPALPGFRCEETRSE
jgi:hypothetical protein